MSAVEGDAPIRFCVIDDHDIVLLGLEAMAEREPDLVFAGGAATVEEGRRLVARERPDVLLLDLRLDGRNSFDLCREVRADYPEIAIVMFTAFGNEELLATAIKAGATGYALKDASTAGLPEILRAVRRDGAYFDPRIANAALMAGMGSSGPTVLSERELTIVKLVAEGADNHEIAEQVHVSTHMVKFHVGTLLRRYGARTRTELVRVLMERHLI